MKRRILYKKRGKVWYYKFADEASYHTTGQSVRAEAEKWIEHHAPKGDDTTLGTYLEPYYVWDRCPLVAYRTKHRGSMGIEHARAQRSRLDRYVLGHPIAAVKLHELKRRDILDWLDDVAREHGAGAANNALGALKACLRHAMFREDMDRDVMFGISPLKVVSYERGVLTPQELQQIFYDTEWWKHPREWIALMLGAFAGLRRGEILLLRWGDINFGGGYITVRQSWKSWQDKIIGPPKWGRERVVPMMDFLKDELFSFQKTVRCGKETDCVVSWDDGSWVSPRSIGWWMDAALEKANINKKERSLSPHSLRHTFVTFLEQSGLRELSIQAIAGHTDRRTTQKYIHLDPSHLVEEIQKVTLLPVASS